MITLPDDYTRWLRAGTLIWSIYFLLLMLADWMEYAPQPLPAPYFLYFGLSILLLLLLAFLPGLPARLGSAYPIPILALMALVPFVGVTLVMPQMDVLPWFLVRGAPVIYIRYWLPEFLVALLLAYGYRMLYVVLYVLVYSAGTITASTLMFPGQGQRMSILLAFFTAFITISIAWFTNRAFSQIRQQHEALEKANRELLEFASTAEDLATSRERVRVARDLHDTLAHSLSGLIVQLETVEGYWDVDGNLARDYLGQAQQTARSGLRETRRALKALRASPLEDVGLLLALHELAESAAEKTGAELSLALPAHLPYLPTQTEQCIYRVAQEATNNVVHHAGGQRLELQLIANNRHIKLIVCDDGTGFELDDKLAPGHYGLAGMQERALLAGGTLEIETGIGQGTTIRLGLPLHPKGTG